MEFVITNPMGIGVKDLVDDIVGHGAERHIPIVATIGIFILFSNMISLVPGFTSPTATITVTLGLRDHRFPVLQRDRHRQAWRPSLCQDASGTDAQAVPDQHHHADRRDGQPFRAAAFAHRPALGQHDGQRAALRFVSRRCHFRFSFSSASKTASDTSPAWCRSRFRWCWLCCTFSWLSCRRSFFRFWRSFISDSRPRKSTNPASSRQQKLPA